VDRLRRPLFGTIRRIRIHRNERRPFPSDLERLTEVDSLTFNKLIETALVLLLDQQACAGPRALQPASTFLKLLNSFFGCKLVDCCANDLFANVNGQLHRSLR